MEFELQGLENHNERGFATLVAAHPSFFAFGVRTNPPLEIKIKLILTIFGHFCRCQSKPIECYSWNFDSAWVHFTATVQGPTTATCSWSDSTSSQGNRTGGMGASTLATRNSARACFTMELLRSDSRQFAGRRNAFPECFLNALMLSNSQRHSNGRKSHPLGKPGAAIATNLLPHLSRTTDRADSRR